MSTPIKILEIKGEDFAKGLSYKSSFPIGGQFINSGNYDPFENYGYLLSTLDYAVANSTTDTPVVITGWNASGVGQLYVHTATKLYKILDGTPYTTTDVSASINVVSPVTGAITFQSRYIYAQAAVTEIYSDPIPVEGGATVRLFNSGGTNTEWYTPMAVAPDKNLYFVHGDVGKITSAIAVDSNVIAYNLEDGMYGRDLVSDGKYLVVVADNNLSNKRTGTRATGNYRCQVLFFDVNNGRSTADYIYEFTDSYVTSVRYLDGVVYIFGKNNFWACNSVSAPKAIFSFEANSTITEIPLSPFQVTQNKNSLFWCGQTNQRIYAFGSLVAGMKKVFYQPYSIGATPSVITNNGTQFYVGSTGSNQMLAVLNTGSTRTLTQTTTTPIFLPQTFSFAFAKVVMKAKLSSGGQVFLGLTNADKNISFGVTKLFSTIGAKQTILFNTENDNTASVKSFEDLKLAVGGNQAIARVEVWGFPIDSYGQNI